MFYMNEQYELVSSKYYLIFAIRYEKNTSKTIPISDN